MCVREKWSTAVWPRRHRARLRFIPRACLQLRKYHMFMCGARVTSERHGYTAQIIESNTGKANAEHTQVSTNHSSNGENTRVNSDLALHSHVLSTRTPGAKPKRNSNWNRNRNPQTPSKNTEKNGKEHALQCTCSGTSTKASPCSTSTEMTLYELC